MIEVLKKSDRLVGVLVTVQRIRVRPFRVKQKTVKLVLIASSLFGLGTKNNDWLSRSQDNMCQWTCLPMGCCFSENQHKENQNK